MSKAGDEMTWSLLIILTTGFVFGRAGVTIAHVAAVSSLIAMLVVYFDAVATKLSVWTLARLYGLIAIYQFAFLLGHASREWSRSRDYRSALRIVLTRQY